MRWTLCSSSDPVALVGRAGAEQEGKPLSQWVEQAILNEAARNDVQLIEEWERMLSPEDQAVLAAFAEADRLADLDK